MRPRLLKIINTDWGALMGGIGAPIIVVGGVAYHFFLERGKVAPTFVALLLPLLLLGVLLLGWRVRRIYELFDRGQSTTGWITNVHLFKDRGQIEFSFEFEGSELKSWMPIHATNDVLKLQPGQKVELLIDPQRPRNAIIKHLFL